MTDCTRCAELEAELAYERSRRTLGGTPPVPARDWGNLAYTPPPATAADEAAPPLHRTTVDEVADMVLLPSRGDEACWMCREPIEGDYTHVVEDGVDVIVCPPCAVDTLPGVAS